MENSIEINKTIFCDLSVELNGKYIFLSDKNVYYQTQNIDKTLQKHLRTSRIELEFIDRFNKGIYREYYLSGKLKRVIPFERVSNSENYVAHGIEKVFYEDADSFGKMTYTILEENEYHYGIRIGIWKVYSIDGGLLSETHYHNSETPNSFSTDIIKQVKYYPANGSISQYEENSYGKSYYESGKLKAEWLNNDFFKNGNYVEYYENGIKKMIVNYFNGERDGIMFKYFEDSTLKEEWSYTIGTRNYVKKYYPNKILKSEWLYCNGNEISKKEFDKSGKLKNI
jgi:antitoxin component YwqK of YwqJK toxin-antitoxin module